MFCRHYINYEIIYTVLKSFSYVINIVIANQIIIVSDRVTSEMKTNHETKKYEKKKVIFFTFITSSPSTMKYKLSTHKFINEKKKPATAVEKILVKMYDLFIQVMLV